MSGRTSVWLRGCGLVLPKVRSHMLRSVICYSLFSSDPRLLLGRLLFCHRIAKIIRALEQTPRLVIDTISVSRFFLPSFVMAVTLLMDIHLIVLWSSFSSDMCQRDRCTLELCQVFLVSVSELPVSYPVVSSYLSIGSRDHCEFHFSSESSQLFWTLCRNLRRIPLLQSS